jgi:predicted CopG family antitoxin
MSSILGPIKKRTKSHLKIEEKNMILNVYKAEMEGKTEEETHSDIIRRLIKKCGVSRLSALFNKYIHMCVIQIIFRRTSLAHSIALLLVCITILLYKLSSYNNIVYES